MQGMATPAFWMLRRATGVRIYHVLGATLMVAAALLALALPFWWLGTHAATSAGVIGVLLIAGTYLASATVLLGFSVVLLWRALISRVRRTLGVV
jgi:hypothetical protein